jgi:hypothetical protein
VRTSHPYYGATSSIPARPKKYFFREGTPELASPCRLFGRRNQLALAPHGAILKQSCLRFNGNRGKAMTIQTKVSDHASRQAQRRGVSRENLVLPNESSLADAQPRGTIMSRIIAAAALMGALTCVAQADSLYGRRSGSGYGLGLPGTGSNPNSHSVAPDIRSGGTYVPRHYRTNPNNTQFDNFDTRGNYNPYTGQTGTRWGRW